MAITSERLTLEEFLRLPENRPALEYVGGEVSSKVAPKGQHVVLQQEFIKRIDSYGMASQLARAFMELRTTFAGASVVPDVSVYLWHRIPRSQSGKIANDFTEPPDIMIEIVSPGQSFKALFQRCLWYISNGVTLAMLVDPEDETVLSFRPDRGPECWTGSDRVSLDPVLPGFGLTVQDLFPALW